MNHPDRVIELDFRPRTYFWPHGLEKALLSQVKGTERRRELQALLAADKFDEIPPWLACAALPPEVHAAAGRIHPAFMGGEYLPDRVEQEVEIARIEIDSRPGQVRRVNFSSQTSWLQPPGQASGVSGSFVRLTCSRR